MSRLLAIGDVHGCSTALRGLLQIVRIGPGDTVVMLGDFMNRGPDTRGVVEELMALSQRTHLVTLMGNHEQMWLRALDSHEDEEEWKACGGDSTLASYGVRSACELPQEHQAFFRSCLRYHEAEAHFFVHANADPYTPLESQVDHTLFWEHLSFAPAAHVSGKTMVCGHTPQKDGKPRYFGRAICVDTNVHDGGWLTCLDVRTGCYWQADQRGRRRTDVLEFEDEEAR
jgi:serine/threonine protein phosphatase 1